MNHVVLPPAIYLTHSYFDSLFLYGAGFTAFMALLVLFLLIFVSIKNYKNWKVEGRIASELFQVFWNLLKALGGPVLICACLMYSSSRWSVTIGKLGVRVIAPLNFIDPGGIVAWADIEEAKIIMRGKYGGVPYINLKRRSEYLTFPVWEMSRDEAQLT